MEAPPRQFRHEAFLYAGEERFLAGTIPFILDGLDAGEPILITVSDAKIRRLRSALGGAAESVSFVDMGEVGRNPARIIPIWRDFVHAHAIAGTSVGVIGEPVWRGRSEAERVECDRHESLVNMAFDTGVPWRLMCSYDVEALDRSAVDAVRRTHPHLVDEDGVGTRSEAYVPPTEGPGPFAGALAEPAAPVTERRFGEDELADVRSLVYRRATDAGLDTERTANIVFAISELAANSVRHGGGRGTLRVWIDPREFVGEVRDDGRFHSPLVGRIRPSPLQLYGRGLWLTNQVCDLVQIRSSDRDNVVRVRMSLK